MFRTLIYPLSGAWEFVVESLAILFHFLSVQHVSDINISIIRSLRLCCWITTSIVLFSVRCVLEIWCGLFWVVSVLQAVGDLVVIQQHSRKLLMMDILMSETCWVYKKWNKKASDIKLVSLYLTITMMHGPINTRLLKMPKVSTWPVYKPIPTSLLWSVYFLLSVKQNYIYVAY